MTPSSRMPSTPATRMAAPPNHAVTASGLEIVGRVASASMIKAATVNTRSTRIDSTIWLSDSANRRASQTRATSPPTVPNGRQLKKMLA